MIMFLMDPRHGLLIHQLLMCLLYGQRLKTIRLEDLSWRKYFKATNMGNERINCTFNTRQVLIESVYYWNDYDGRCCCSEREFNTKCCRIKRSIWMLKQCSLWYCMGCIGCC